MLTTPVQMQCFNVQFLYTRAHGRYIPTLSSGAVIRFDWTHPRVPVHLKPCSRPPEASDTCTLATITFECAKHSRQLPVFCGDSPFRLFVKSPLYVTTMLPNLSNKCKLQLLIPVSIEPAWMSARRQALLELKTIVDVRVTGRTGKGSKALYTVEVFRNSVDNSDSPTSVDPVATGGRPLKAAVRTEKTLSEFGLLRGDIYDTAWSAHNNAHCEFCTELVELYVLGSADPEALTLRLLGEERALRKLTKLLNDLLTLTVRNSSVDGRGVCSGQAHIPQLLYNFFFGHEPEEAQAA